MAAPRSAADRRAAAEVRRARRAEVTDTEIVMEAAAAFLAVRSRSVAEVRRRLRHLGFQAIVADTVVDRFLELGVLDDRAFALAWVESRDRVRPRGVMALRQELQRLGVPREVCDDILAERASTAATQQDGSTAEAELAAAARLLAKRASTLRREEDPRRRQQRAYALLARYGFAPDVCRRAVLASVEADAELLEADA